MADDETRARYPSKVDLVLPTDIATREAIERDLNDWWAELSLTSKLRAHAAIALGLDI